MTCAFSKAWGGLNFYLFSITGSEMFETNLREQQNWQSSYFAPFYKSLCLFVVFQISILFGECSDFPQLA